MRCSGYLFTTAYKFFRGPDLLEKENVFYLTIKVIQTLNVFDYELNIFSVACRFLKSTSVA